VNLDSLGPAAEQLLAREEEMQALDEWLGDTGRSPTLVVLGGPGIGKSCVLRKWVHRRRMAAGADAARDWHVIQHEIQPGARSGRDRDLADRTVRCGDLPRTTPTR
jgi:hypothetical protein